MGRFFINKPQIDKPLAQTGLSEGWARLEEAWEELEIIGGHLEWQKGSHKPRIVIDNDPTQWEDLIRPKAFDIKSIDPTTGTLTITRCKWQVQAKYYSAADISLTAQTGVVCAVLDTTTGTLTAQMDYVWTDTAPELVPYALYDIIVTTVDSKQVVRITCDRRGSAIQFHG